jgi:hypothetical protein
MHNDDHSKGRARRHFSARSRRRPLGVDDDKETWSADFSFMAVSADLVIDDLAFAHRHLR